jgi:hypothetical protein
MRNRTRAGPSQIIQIYNQSFVFLGFMGRGLLVVVCAVGLGGVVGHLLSSGCCFLPFIWFYLHRILFYEFLVLFCKLSKE